VHDISRTELDLENNLPRFNMPLELGLFLGARHFGRTHDKKKVTLILDVEKYRYQKFCSDLAGQDVVPHDNRPELAVAAVRDWLAAHSDERIPSAVAVTARYALFRQELPELCKSLELDSQRLIFSDYAAMVEVWLREHAI